MNLNSTNGIQPYDMYILGNPLRSCVQSVFGASLLNKHVCCQRNHHLWWSNHWNHIWGFPWMGVPPVIIHSNLRLIGFPLINHPFGSNYPHSGNPHFCLVDSCEILIVAACSLLGAPSRQEAAKHGWGTERQGAQPRWVFLWVDMKNIGGSINGGNPKWLLYSGTSHWNGWWLGVTLFQETSTWLLGVSENSVCPAK